MGRLDLSGAATRRNGLRRQPDAAPKLGGRSPSAHATFTISIEPMFEPLEFRDEIRPRLGARIARALDVLLS